MTGHQINSLVGDLVAMAQAMERLPQVEADLAEWRRMAGVRTETIISLQADLEQAKSYAASLEAKVHNAEVARDDAELRFLELDERAAKAVRFLGQVQGMAVQAELELSPPKPQPEPQPEPMVETGPVTEAEVGSAPSLETVQRADHVQTAQGQSEPDPIHVEATTVATEPVPMSSNATEAVGETQNNGPYHGRRYLDVPARVSREDWLAGGGTNEDYDLCY